MKHQFPLISVVIATFNSAKTLERSLSSLKRQKYSHSLIELVIADGGSTDATLEIAKKYKARLIQIAQEKQNPEFNKGMGLVKARGELILFIDHDNVLPHRLWLKNMVKPLLENPEIVAVEPLRYHYSPHLAFLDRYFALFGVNDPLAYYLGKADRMDYIHDTYNLIGKVKNQGGYLEVKFDQKNPQKIPTLGANGFLIRKKILQKVQISPECFLHIDINVDLVKQGFTKYAFIKDSIIHLTQTKASDFFKRRIWFMQKYYFQQKRKRRYSVYTEEDLGKLILFIIFSLTLIKPLIDSFRGWRKMRDVAWFLHPIMCFVTVIVYGFTTIDHYQKIIFRNIRL